MNTKETDFLLDSHKSDGDRSTGTKDARKLMLFDLSVGGHHAVYIQHLLRYWCERGLPGHLDIVVLPKFMQQHSEVVEIAATCPQKTINFVSIAPEEAAALKPRNYSLNRALRAFQEWQLLDKYAAALKTSHCLIMYFDTCDYPLILGAKLSCPFSGIYFKPIFHYSDFANYVPSWKTRLQEWRQKLSLLRILHTSQLQTLFCLDPFVSVYLDKFHSHVKAVNLPDPVQIYSSSKFQLEELRKGLTIEPKRKVFLLFGSLTDPRKGCQQIIKAISKLPSALSEKLCVVFVGEADPVERAPLEAQIADVCQSRPVQILCRYEFVPEEDVSVYFHLADVVLATYQRHIGMSGILMLAAAAQKPVLSSNYGLMGEIVRQYKLGLTVDSTLPEEIVKGLALFLTESPNSFCDRTTMREFAEHNSPDKFAEIIFHNL